MRVFWVMVPASHQRHQPHTSYPGGEICACDLGESFDLSQPTISQSALLRRATAPGGNAGRLAWWLLWCRAPTSEAINSAGYLAALPACVALLGRGTRYKVLTAR